MWIFAINFMFKIINEGKKKKKRFTSGKRKKIQKNVLNIHTANKILIPIKIYNRKNFILTKRRTNKNAETFFQLFLGWLENF